MLTFISSICTFNSSISFLLIKVVVCECSSCSCVCDVSMFSNLETFSSNTAIELSILDVSIVECSCDSNASNFVNGHTLYVDGGITASL